MREGAQTHRLSITHCDSGCVGYAAALASSTGSIWLGRGLHHPMQTLYTSQTPPIPLLLDAQWRSKTKGRLQSCQTTPLRPEDKRGFGTKSAFDDGVRQGPVSHHSMGTGIRSNLQVAVGWDPVCAPLSLCGRHSPEYPTSDTEAEQAYCERRLEGMPLPFDHRETAQCQ